MVKACLTAEQQASLVEAIKACEQQTAAELVVMVAEQSDSYNDIAYLWSLVIASLGTWGLWWGELLYSFPALWIAQVILFLSTLILLQESRLSVKLAPRKLQHKRAAYAAAAQFTLHQMTHTAHRTGILLYVSLGEHYAEIRADQSVTHHIPQETWDTLLQPLLLSLPTAGLATALTSTIYDCGILLAPYLPPSEHDNNELPDMVVLS